MGAGFVRRERGVSIHDGLSFFSTVDDLADRGDSLGCGVLQAGRLPEHINVTCGNAEPKVDRRTAI